MSGTGVEKLQTILMAQVSTIDQPDQISIDYTKRFIFANYLSFNTSFGWIPPPPCILVNLSIVLNSFYFFLYHVIFGWMIWSLIITLDTLSIWLFALPVGCSQKPYRCIHSSTWRLFKNHQSCKSEGSRNREKVFVQRLSWVKKISSFFFVARKTIAKGKVQAKYLKHLLVNYSFILIIGFFLFFFWKLWF